MVVNLDPRICDACPLGPVPMMHDPCKRCDADARAILFRADLFSRLRPVLTIGDIDYTDCFYYSTLPRMLPRSDPAAA